MTDHNAQDDARQDPPGPLVLFPRWANYLLPALVLLVIGVTTYVPTVLIFGLSPRTTDVGYRPTQPVPFDHAQHVSGLGLDCRYCHSTVETAAFAAIPPTQTCMNCHHAIKSESSALEVVRASFQTGEPIAWQKIHDLPDYTYFNHAAHVNKGVGCVTCHGRVDQMTQVFQARTLSMAWCLECHRDPEQFLRPRDQVTNTAWAVLTDSGLSQAELGAQLKQHHNVAGTAFLTSCSTCHR